MVVSCHAHHWCFRYFLNGQEKSALSKKVLLMSLWSRIWVWHFEGLQLLFSLRWYNVTWPLRTIPECLMSLQVNIFSFSPRPLQFEMNLVWRFWTPNWKVTFSEKSLVMISFFVTWNIWDLNTWLEVFSREKIVKSLRTLVWLKIWDKHTLANLYIVVSIPLSFIRWLSVKYHVCTTRLVLDHTFSRQPFLILYFFRFIINVRLILPNSA